MSTSKAISLLREYNKKSPYQRTQSADTQQDQNQKRLGTWSYANSYDALYDKYSRSKNFNINMWQDAIRLGEQDQYLAFLEQNKDNTMSDKFYDPQYYDYEAMMLEMYLPLADNTNAEKYTRDVFDQASGKWVKEDIGEMTERQYYEYLLNNTRIAREEEIIQQIEQQRKDSMHFMEKLGHSAAATFAEFGEGILSALTGILDVFGSVGYATGAAIGGQDWADAFVEYYGELGLTALEKDTIRAALDEYERTHTYFRDIDGNMTGWGTYLAGVANSFGMMAPAILVNMIPGVGQWVGSTMFYSAIFSGNMHENATNTELGGPAYLKIVNAGIKAGAEYLIEWGLGKAFGSTAQNFALGIGGKGAKTAFKGITKTAGAKFLLKSAAQEGLEEFLQDFGTNLVDQFMSIIDEGYGKNGVTFQTLIDSFFVGMLSSVVMSGGQVAMNAAKTASTNAYAKRLDKIDSGHRYNKELDIGPGDLVIETDDGVQKLRGLNKLYYSSILSEFKSSIEELKKGKISTTKNLELAKEVYGAISAISQYYSSFDAKRIENCEMLLDRVAKAEQLSLKATFSQQYARAASILSPETITDAAREIAKDDKAFRKQVKENIKAKGKTLAAYMEYTFNEMVGGVGERHRAKLKKVVTENEEELKKAGVTQANVIVDTDGTVYAKDPEREDLVSRLGKKGADVLAELRQGYEWLITTDGGIALEGEGFLFISESWLKNYETSEIYKYLEQTRVLNTIAEMSKFKPMLNKLVAFYKDFRKVDKITVKEALMNFLFDEETYQGFLLSNAGANIHEFKEFIFQFHDIVRDLASSTKYHQQLFRGKQAQYRINMLKKVYDTIKNTMRRPTLKAILSWGIDPQSVAADSVLTPSDRELVAKYKNYKRILSSTGADHSAYENLAEDIIANAESNDLNDEELALIRKSLDGTATIDEDIEARALLEEASRRMTRYDFEVSPDHSYYLASADRLVERLESVEFTKISESYFDKKQQTILSLVNDINWYVQEAINDAPGYMDSRNLGTEAGIVERTVERIKETLKEYNYDTSENSDIDFLVDHIGDDGSLKTLEEDVAELTRLLKASLDITRETPYDVAMEQIREIIDDIETFVDDMRHRANIPKKLRDRINSWYERSFKSGLINRGTEVDLNLIAMSGVQLMRDYCAYIEKNTMEHRKKVGLGAFVVPYQVAAMVMNDGDIAEAQFVTDKLNEFENIYGISARQMIMGDLTGMSTQQRNQLTQDMEILEVDNITLFVIKKLEGMLGNKYIVTPTSLQYKSDRNEFTVVANPAFNESKDWARLSERLETDRNSVTRWFEERKNVVGVKESRAYTLVEEFYEYTTTLQPSNYSDFNEFLTDENKAFWKELGKLYRNQSASSAFKYILSNKDLILAQFDAVDRVLSQSASKEALKDYDDTHVLSNVYDFTIARAIPAETLLSHNILAEDIETRDAIFRQVFNTDGAQNRQLFARKASEYFDRYSSDATLRDYFDGLLMAYDFEASDIDQAFNYLASSYYETNMVIDPFTGEILELDDPRREFYIDILSEGLITSTVAPLSAFIDVNAFPTINLDKITVRFEDAGEGNAGYASGNKIVIDPHKSDDYFGILVHEVNHILQERYNMPNGFNTKTAGAMPDFLAYVVNHYPNYIKYTLRRAGYGKRIELPNIGHVTETDIMALPKYLKDLIAHCGYMLVQGELWARAYTHNGKPVHGFAEIFGTHGIYLLAPDGKTKFKVRFAEATSTETSYTSDVVADSALDVAIQKLFYAHGRLNRGDEGITRDTYHSALTRVSSAELNRKIMSPTVPLMDRLSVRLGHIIQDPQHYLAPEILAMCKGNFSEGNVVNRIREWVEANIEGVSIDLKDGPIPEYVWVNDDAFDDILSGKVKSQKNSEKTSLVEEYGTGEHIPLSKFYKPYELARLGVNPSAYVVIAPDVKTETRFDNEHRTGAIFIRSTVVRDNNIVARTDASVINALNHEFRHILQYYNGFVTGFTPDFAVSKEMLADVKAHVPSLFKDDNIVRWAKTIGKDKWEDTIVQHFVYWLSSGELMAYGIKAEYLYSKPVFVTKEAGNPTIFMPWYNAETGEGRYKTKYLAARGKDEDARFIKVFGTPGPKVFVNKKPKYKEAVIESLDTPEATAKYLYDANDRKFSAKKAQGTNLKYFVKKGEQNQMDPALQEFIIDTTGHEDELPPELWNVIGGKRKGLLTKQALFKWFRRVDAKRVNQFTFDLINKHFFNNSNIKNMEQLNAITIDPSLWWAAVEVLYESGVPIDALGVKNDVNSLMAFLDGTAGTKWRNKIEARQKLYSTLKIGTKDGGYKRENIPYDEKVQQYMRVLTMQWFDGTLTGAFYTATAGRKVLRNHEAERRNLVSLDAKKSNAKGDKATSLGDTISNSRGVMIEDTSVGNDIIALYEQENMDTGLSDTEMIQALSIAYYESLCREAGIDPAKTERTDPDVIPLLQKTMEYLQKLGNLSYDEIAIKYAQLRNTELTDTTISDDTFDTEVSDGLIDTRDNVARRIQGRAKTILKWIMNGEIAFTDLSEDARNLFHKVEAVTETGKKTFTYELKPESYSVGGGRAALPGETDKRKGLYEPKHDIRKGNALFKHDISGIVANYNLLVQEKQRLNTLKKIRGKDRDTAKRIMKQEADKSAYTLAAILSQQNAPEEEKIKVKTEFKRPGKKKRTSDTPNIFTIQSGIEMPHVLYKILDTSFEDFADTLVQFASRDENTGQVYDKDYFKDKEFESRVKHEVTNWETFYEANRDTLLSLTRKDVLDIIEFFQRSAGTIDGPASKLAAFEIFILGYLLDGARRNFNNWDFSDAETKMLEELYIQKASAHGSGLNAVNQMLKVVDPMKKVRQRMFDDWDAVSDEDKDKLIAAVDAMQDEKNLKAQIDKAQTVMQMLKEFGEKQMLADKSKYPRWSKNWWKRLWSKTKSWRYLAMLSNPTTWIRNGISNVLVLSFNSAANKLGNLIFFGKGYREDQWNLNGVKISSEAKNFIDTYIKSNPIFTPDKKALREGHAIDLYNLSTKYDPRPKKKLSDEKGRLVGLIARAYEKMYDKNNRFDSKTMKNIARFIDNRISDETFVKLVAGRYYGKMLTIEAERGNIDLSAGFEEKAMDLFAEAVILANQEYMHKRSFMADMLDGIRDKHPKAHEALTFWQPFINSSLNWFAEGLKYTPLGLANSIVKACTLEKQITKLNEKRAKGEFVTDSRVAQYLIRQDLGKGILGLLLSGLGIMLALAGCIRIDEEDDKFYMYVYGDTKLDITNLFGSSSVLVGASVAQHWIEQTDGNVATYEEVLSMLADTMLDGFIATDLLERHKWGGTLDDILTETESVMRSFVPQIWQTIIACTNQKNIRYSAGFEGMWERWLNTFVPTQPFGNRKVNPYTGEIEDKYSMPIIGALLQKGVLGPKIYWVEISEIERMCREFGVNKNELTGELTVQGKKIELDRITLNKKYGELNKDSLTKIKSQRHDVEMPDGKYKTLSWDQMSDKQRARVLNRTMTHNADLAKIYVWTQIMGKKYYASDSLWKDLKRLGIATNVYKGDKGFVE